MTGVLVGVLTITVMFVTIAFLLFKMGKDDD